MADEFDELKQNIGIRSTWVRLFFMIIFAIVFWFAELIIGLVTIFQFLHVLFTARPNENLLRFGRSLAVYVGDIVRFLTYNSEDRPFPFGEWPQDGKPAARSGAGRKKKAASTAKPKAKADDEDESDSAGA